MDTSAYDQQVTTADGITIQIQPVAGGSFTQVSVHDADRRLLFNRNYQWTDQAISEYGRQCRIYGASKHGEALAKKLGEMTAADRLAVARRAASRLQDELRRDAPAISAMLEEGTA